jgi:ribonuclease Z
VATSGARRRGSDKGLLRVTFLGTASARPTPSRNVSSIALQREGDLFLLDCGEGTQRQMMRFGVGFALQGIFVTHMHADHYLGITGLLRTLSLQGRTEPLPIWGPPRSEATLRSVIELGGDRLVFPVRTQELEPGEAVSFEGYAISAFPTRHTSDSIGLVLEEAPRLGRFDVQRARELGVPEGPDFGRLHRGESVRLSTGGVVTASEVVGPQRPGRKLVYTGDTRPCAESVEAAASADLLIHEATFGEEESERAQATGHSTALEAAQIARSASVRELVLTHVSARYSEQAYLLRREAKSTFSRARVADDGLVVEVPLRDEGPGSDG